MPTLVRYSIDSSGSSVGRALSNIDGESLAVVGAVATAADLDVVVVNVVVVTGVDLVVVVVAVVPPSKSSLT
jgi:hypothetical protein